MTSQRNAGGILVGRVVLLEILEWRQGRRSAAFWQSPIPIDALVLTSHVIS